MPNKMWRVLFLALPLAAAAHEPVRDPVCGMMVDPEHAAATAEWDGKTWHFCQAAERDLFLAEPAKYVSALRVKRFFRGGVLIVSVDPAAPAAGAPVRIRLMLAPEKDGVPDESRPRPLADPLVRFWRVDRERPPAEEILQAQPLGGNVYGTLRWLEAPGPYRLVVEAATESGEEVRGIVAFEAGPPVPESTAGGEFTMAAQHAVMRRFGREWLGLHEELSRAEPDARSVAGSLARLQEDRRLMPKFTLHVNADDKPEFDALAEELDRPLRRLGELAAAGKWDDARAQWRAADAESCTRCHLKFRWNAVRDLTRFPQVREEGK